MCTGQVISKWGKLGKNKNQRNKSSIKTERLNNSAKTWYHHKPKQGTRVVE